MLQVWYISFLFSLVTFSGLKVVSEMDMLIVGKNSAEQSFSFQKPGLSSQAGGERFYEEVAHESTDRIYRILIGERKKFERQSINLTKISCSKAVGIFILFEADNSPPSLD